MGPCGACPRQSSSFGPRHQGAQLGWPSIGSTCPVSPHLQQNSCGRSSRQRHQSSSNHHTTTKYHCIANGASAPALNRQTNVPTHRPSHLLVAVGKGASRSPPTPWVYASRHAAEVRQLHDALSMHLLPSQDSKDHASDFCAQAEPVTASTNPFSPTASEKLSLICFNIWRTWVELRPLSYLAWLSSILADLRSAWRDQLLLRRASPGVEHIGLFREHRPAAERELNICRDYRER